MARCLYCYEELQPSESTLHVKCSRRVFSTLTPPQLPYSSSEITQRKGAQLSIDKESNSLKFVEGAGEYTLLSNDDNNIKAQLEAVTMRMADIARIPVTPHTLLRSSEGLFHHVRRVTEHGKKKVKVTIQKMSDLVEDSDRNSYEMVAEALQKISTTPKLDIINLYERVLFCYLVGATQHGLESLIMAKNGCGTSLAPASSIMPNAMLSPDNEMIMSLNSRYNDLTRSDFESALLASDIEPKIIGNLFTKFERSIDKWCDLIDSSPLPNEIKESYKFQMIIRFDTL